MRITRDQLLNLARENAEKLSAKDRGMVSIFLTGSLLRADSFIGGITDIDLFCIHDRPIPVKREIVRINQDVHLDIAHFTQEDFLPARKLRTDAWFGGTLDKGVLLLKDSAHWFDLMRTAAISQYWQPANISARVNSFISSARQAWMALQEETIPQGIKRTQAFLNAIQDTANAGLVISGTPLPMRRLFIELPDSLVKSGIGSLSGALVDLFTSDQVTDEHWTNWLAEWSDMFEALKELKEVPPSIHPNRRSYYEKAVDVLVETRPFAALWIVLNTWTRAAAILPKSDECYKTWQSMCKQLSLDTKGISSRLEALDSALEVVEEANESLQG